MKRVVILISGRGSNMEALVGAREAGELPVDIVAVISNKADAGGLATAQAHGIATAVVAHKEFATREDFDAALQAKIDGYQPDLVVLAGFLRVLTTAFVEHYAGRMINIHPSLLPAFPGLHTHERAIEAGCKLHGATVHFVTPELDHGPIIVQAAVPVLPGDTPDDLAARVLKQEHVIYARAVRWFAANQLRVKKGVVTVELPDAQQLVVAQ